MLGDNSFLRVCPDCDINREESSRVKELLNLSHLTRNNNNIKDIK